MMNNIQTITTNETMKHLKTSSTRRPSDKKHGHSSPIRYVQGSLLDYLQNWNADSQHEGGNHA